MAVDRGRQAEIERLRAALVSAKEKLEAYFKGTEGRYPGGPLYQDLMRKIDAALKKTSHD